MELRCDDCGKAWDKGERDAPSETLCPLCRTVDWARELAEPSPARETYPLDRRKVLSLLELQNNVLKKRLHAPDPISAASLKHLEDEVLARSAARRAVAPVDIDSSDDAGDRITVPSGPVAALGNENDDDPTLRRIVRDDVLAAKSAPVSLAPPPARARPPLPPKAARAKQRLAERSRGSWLVFDVTPPGAEDLFDGEDHADDRITPAREPDCPIPLVSRRVAPDASTSTTREPRDPGSLSAFAIDDSAAVTTSHTPRPRRMPAAPAPRARHLTSGLLAATVLALTVMVYGGGRVHDDPAPATALASAPGEPELAASPTSAAPEPASIAPVIADAPVESAPSTATAPTPAPKAEVASARKPVRPAAPTPELTSSEATERQAKDALRNGDLTRALDLYEQLLATNSGYLPARLSVADIQWASGNHQAARSSYARVLDDFPRSMIPERALARAKGMVVRPAK